jgi:hypothetical protein
MAAAALAQKPPAASAPPAGQTPAQSHPATKANDELLARAGKLYYSTAHTGFEGFDCAIHPDWHALFVSAQPGVPIAADDPRIVLLKSAKIALHAHAKGNSSVEWTPPATAGKPLDESSANMLDGLHQAVEQSLMGFLQFWTPFVDGSAVPASSEGLELTKTEDGYRLYAEENGTAVTEVLDNQLLLKEFHVAMNQATVDFAPAYKPTEKGLLVSSFLAHVLPAGAPSGQAQEMHVTIAYQTVDGFAVPAELTMNVLNSGAFEFALDGCTVSRLTK